MTKWYLLDGRGDDLLKKIKALRDAPGTEGERAAAEAAYNRVSGKTKNKPKIPSKEYGTQKRQSVEGPGGFDYEDPTAWKRLLKEKAVFRFISDYAKSRWKQLHSVGVKDELPILEISDWPAGTNKATLTMSRRVMGTSGIEFRPKRISESKWSHLIESDEASRKEHRKRASGDEPPSEDYVMKLGRLFLAKRATTELLNYASAAFHMLGARDASSIFWDLQFDAWPLLRSRPTVEGIFFILDYGQTGRKYRDGPLGWRVGVAHERPNADPFEYYWTDTFPISKSPKDSMLQRTNPKHFLTALEKAIERYEEMVRTGPTHRMRFENLDEAEERWRDLARKYKAGDDSLFAPLVRELIRTGKLPHGRESTIGDIEDVLVELGVHNPTTLRAIQTARDGVINQFNWMATRIREHPRMAQVVRNAYIQEIDRYRRLRDRQISTYLEWLRDEDWGMHNYEHNSSGYLRRMRMGSGEFARMIRMIPSLSDEYKVLIDREQVLHDAFVNAFNFLNANRARLKKSEEE